MKRFTMIFAATLFLVSGVAFAQISAGPAIDEKANQAPKNPAAVASILEGVATFSGSLTGGPTYDRIFTSDVQNDCTATSTFSGSGTGVEYAMVPIYSPTGATLVGTLDNPGTDIDDTVLSLYCDPFDPANADLNLVGYNDDFSGLISGFDGTEGIVLAPNTQYFLVVSLFSPGDIGGGNFELAVGGLNGGEEVVFGSPLPEARAVPTLGFAGMAVLVLVLAACSVVALRRNA